MKPQKILISGYYGFDNFGDELILEILVNELKKNFTSSQITVISSNPDKTKSEHNVESIYTFGFSKIFKKIKDTDVFINGGGSLLQDVTSLKSLLYYLFLIFTALLFRKKTIMFAQGIGPINNNFGMFLTKHILKNVDYISVRDTESRKLLADRGINSEIVVDPAWGLDTSCIKKEKPENFCHVGIQLRDWKNINSQTLETMAKSFMENFDIEKTVFNIISLHDSIDLKMSKEMEKALKTLNNNAKTVLYSDLSINDAVKTISGLDYFFAMRFHACLLAIKMDIPTIALCYDPKVEYLAKEAEIPFLDTDNIEKIVFASKINELKHLYKIIKNNEKLYEKKYTESRQSFDLLIKIISR
jgi:polysaccharide pyruvyl transferase CsaB